MDLQTVSVTDIQRNFKRILDNLVPKNPTFILRDSVPEAVIVSMEEYKRLTTMEKKALKDSVTAVMDDLAQKNKYFSNEEIDRDIEYAKKHARSY